MVAGQQALSAATTRPRAALLRASLLLLGVAIVSKLTTLAADSFVAARFGLSVDADAYLLAIGLTSALLAAPSETLRLAVVPVCGRYLQQGELRGAGEELAGEILSKASSESIARTKRMLLDVLGRPLDQRFDRAAEANAQSRLTEDCRAGVAAFLESKRTPNWRR